MEVRKTGRACYLGSVMGTGKMLPSLNIPSTHGNRHICNSERVNSGLKSLTKSQKRKHSSGHSKWLYPALTKLHSQSLSLTVHLQGMKFFLTLRVLKLQFSEEGKQVSFQMERVSWRNQLHLIKIKNRSR